MRAVGPPIDAVLLVKPEPEHYHLLSVGLWQMLLLVDHPVRRNDLDSALPVPASHQRRSQNEKLSSRAVASVGHVTFVIAWSITRNRMPLLVCAKG